MNAKSILRIVAMMTVAVGVTTFPAGCQGIPKGTTESASIGSMNVQATGAGIIKADAQTVTFKIKCGLCGFEPESITIPTPIPGKPYTTKWACSRCGHKQSIVIAVKP